jgi:hypothetical protein
MVNKTSGWRLETLLPEVSGKGEGMKANWKSMESVPRDRPIVLWHRVWQCPIACKWNGHGFVELTYSHTWKESDFSAWDEMPARPLQDSIPVRYDSTMPENILQLDGTLGTVTIFNIGKERDEKEAG